MRTNKICRMLGSAVLIGLLNIAGENLVRAQDELSFTRQDVQVGSWPIYLTMGDFNGDGHLDLAVSNSGGDTVSILLGTGEGTFQRAVDVVISAAPFALKAGAFNGDGHLDLVVINGGFDGKSDKASILLGTGEGTFQRAPDIWVGEAPGGLTVGDFNGDDRLDLAVTNRGPGTVSILLGTGEGTFQRAPDIWVGETPADVTVGDFNGDGHLDLAVTHGEFNMVSILLGTGEGTFKHVQDIGVEGAPFSFSTTVEDFDGDSNLDLARPISRATP